MEHFQAIEHAKQMLEEIYPGENVNLPEAAYRWMYHHSKLGENDAVIVGASSLEQLQKNLEYASKGGLDERIVEFFDEWCKKTMHLCPSYAR